MVSTAEALKEVRGAIEQLRSASRHDNDASRGSVAGWLERQFSDIDSRDELRAAAADAMRLYKGGMGSFHDTGTAVMDTAVERLRLSLRRARSLLLRR